MNAKKCKALRRALRQEIKDRGLILPANGIVYKDTKKLIGYTFPKGWLKDRFVRLAVCGGPWLEEAKRQAVPQYARQALNVPGSFRDIYRKAKRVTQAAD